MHFAQSAANNGRANDRTDRGSIVVIGAAPCVCAQKKADVASLASL
jgi:hypothetical protein